MVKQIYTLHLSQIAKTWLFLCSLLKFSLFLEGEKPETKQKRLEAKYAALQIVPNIEKLGTAKVCLIITY